MDRDDLQRRIGLPAKDFDLLEDLGLVVSRDGQIDDTHAQRLIRDAQIVRELVEASRPVGLDDVARRFNIKPEAVRHLQHEGLLSRGQIRERDIQALLPVFRSHRRILDRFSHRVDHARRRTVRCLQNTFRSADEDLRAVAILAFWVEVAIRHRRRGHPIDPQIIHEGTLALIEHPNPRLVMTRTDTTVNLGLSTLLGAHVFSVDERVLPRRVHRLVRGLPAGALQDPPPEFYPLPFLDELALLSAYPPNAVAEAIKHAIAAMPD